MRNYFITNKNYLKINNIIGWGGRIRTYGTRDQNPMPYHLATPQTYIGLHYLKFIFKNFRTTNPINTIVLFFTKPDKVFCIKIFQ